MGMRAHSKLPLDDDLIYRIFTFLPDFSSLQAFLPVSKAIHQVYLTYPESIVRAIAYNIAGPALPHALRLIKFQLSEDRGDDTYPPDELVNVEHITPLEARQMPRIAEIAHEFETRFSRLHKNRCVSTSTLTPPESLRFQRALYRIWLFTAHFTPRFCDLDGGDEDEIADIKRTCVKFISDLGDREVFEMHSVTLFLEELSQGVVNSDSAWSSFVKCGLMAGPEVLLQCLHEWSIFPIEGESEIPIEETPEELRDDYLVYPITRTLEKRQLKVPTDSVVVWKNILDEVVGENDQCELCHKTEGLKLWSEHNWDLLRSVHSPDSMANLLKGRLRATPNGHTLCNYLQDRTLCFSAVLGVIFDELKRPQYEALEKQHGLCIQCLDTFLSDHLHLWLLDRRRKAGNPDLEDCWYGYNCRTQTHRLAHATKLNHLCEPVKGDP